MIVLPPYLTMRFEISLNAPTSFRSPRGAKLVRRLGKRRREVEISHKTVKRLRGADGLRLIGVCGRVRVGEMYLLRRREIR